jgi:hypothetical protein
MEDSLPDADAASSYLPLSEGEHKVLALYDRLQELRLEIAIINAQARQTGSYASFSVSLYLIITI